MYVVLIYDFVIACFLLEADDVRFESDEEDVTTQHDEGTHLPAFPFVKFDSLLSPGEWYASLSRDGIFLICRIPDNVWLLFGTISAVYCLVFLFDVTQTASSTSQPITRR